MKNIGLLILMLFVITGCSMVEQPLPEIYEAGSQQVSEVDGMILLYVPAGEFIMGSANPDAPPDELPQHTINLDAYWIDQTEVTNAMYTQCVKADVCEEIVTPRPDMDDKPNYPVQGVSWPNADAYCQWAGRRLPTEAEWEKAARGTDGRLYPWGNQPPDETLANFNDIFDDVMPVGSFSAGSSPYGALDMAGNVYEWVADWYTGDYYLSSPYENPSGPDGNLQKVLRGGDFLGQAIAIRTTNRYWSYPYRNDFDGFRCAMDAIK